MFNYEYLRGGLMRILVPGLAALVVATAPAAGQSKDAKSAKGTQAQETQPDTGLKARVDSLEEQLVDMQVVVGTLESLAKNGGATAPAAFPQSSAPAAAVDGDAAGRIDGLETQVRALTAQLQQLSDQVRSLGGTPRRSDIPAAPDSTQVGSLPAPASDATADPAASSGASSGQGFGSTTVSPGGDAIGGLINNGNPAAAPATPMPPKASALSAPVPPGAAASANFDAGATPAPVATAALLPVDAAADPKQLYETAYGYLLQRDYGAAEASFSDFLKRFPSDSLAGNAQYWLGETHFVRGQYKAAAGDFLKGYQTYAQSPKAPDSLLKLAMSLDRLGQKDAACSSYSELTSKFPNAPQSVKARAQTERQRVGCPS